MATLFSMSDTDANRELISTVLSVLKDSPEVSSLFNLGGTINFQNGGRMKNEHIHVPSGDNMLRTLAMYVCEKGWDIEAVERDSELGMINVVLSKGEQDPYAGVVLHAAV